jgi:hypothetical protein
VERRYLSKKEYRLEKTRLTRAINSDDPEKILAAIEHAMGTFEGAVWPDDWHRWAVALDDLAWSIRFLDVDDSFRARVRAAHDLFHRY